MEINKLESEMKMINKTGATLNLEEKMRLEIGVKQITDKFQLDQVLVWGKVCGIYNDYYILLGLQMRGQHCFPEKVYFWCNRDFVLGQLNVCKEEQKELLAGLKCMPFTGQHEKVCVQGLTELDRLSWTVSQIEYDCAAVPIGAFKITPTNQLRYNNKFRGLSVDRLGQLASYQHFRTPQSQEKKELILSNEAIHRADFLDSLQDDQPRDCWSVQQDFNPTEVTLRSLLWPGYVAYHRSNSNCFGRLYIGNGQQTADLPFII